MSLEQEFELIRRVPIFSTTDPSMQKLLAFSSDRLTYEEGQVMFSAGDPPDSAYIVMEGEVDITVPTPRGPLLGPGVAVMHAAEVQPAAAGEGRQAGAQARGVGFAHPGTRDPRGLHRARTPRLRGFAAGRKHRKRGVADEAQHLAAVLEHRTGGRREVIVEQPEKALLAERGRQRG